MQVTFGQLKYIWIFENKVLIDMSRPFTASHVILIIPFNTL